MGHYENLYRANVFESCRPSCIKDIDLYLKIRLSIVSIAGFAKTGDSIDGLSKISF